jgi:hypothetical protein
MHHITGGRHVRSVDLGPRDVLFEDKGIVRTIARPSRSPTSDEDEVHGQVEEE